MGPERRYQPLLELRDARARAKSGLAPKSLVPAATDTAALAEASRNPS